MPYLTADINAGYDLFQTNRLQLSADLGYRVLYMNLHMDNDLGYYHEEDINQGPYASIRIKFCSKEMWKFVKRKDRKMESNE